MTSAIALMAALLTSAPGQCFLVTTHHIVRVPSCDFSPGAISELARDAEPPANEAKRADPDARGPTSYASRPYVRDAPAGPYPADRRP